MGKTYKIKFEYLIFNDIVKTNEGRTGKVVPLFKYLLYILPPQRRGGLLIRLWLNAESMKMETKKPKRSEQVKAYVTPAERSAIVESSERVGLTLSEFVRRVCLGARIESREDQQTRREFLKVNADLGRLGGLLKQTLAAGHKEQIYRLLHKIDQPQAHLKAKIRIL